MQSSLKISLLLATLGRTEQLKFFLEKVRAQSYQNFEIVIVDQNADNRLDALLASHGGNLAIKHLHCAPGLSKARNVGLKSCDGDIIAFPDDDCWYPPNLLARVMRLLNSDYDGVTGRQLDSKDRDSGPRYDRKDGPITLFNVWGRGISSCIFLKRHAVEAVGEFDETLGVGAGTPYGSGEETDYLIRVVKGGFRLNYLPDLFVRHPPSEQVITSKMLERTYFYGAGMGYVLRKHHYPLWFKARSLTRPLLGAALALVRLEPKRARLHWTRCLGRSHGLLAQHPST
ncbi:glycosyltransferase family 2 protein [Burkholderia sp. L27(2015)]|uniref:glycosyltransferase family 2 protein n=1 Tax=Burkholderia sp. L27(2015) TaxID=1641858 RepID=UPI00131D96A9|nr:glycosyltransferase family A protein [Burkholderia sp. L27(2015)]